MADDLITFVIDGSEERRGAIPAEAFLVKLRAFIATIYAFDRAFSKKDKRQLDLEIVDLSRNSPAQIAMRPRIRTVGYPAAEAIEWTFDQLGRIYRGEEVDAAIPQATLDNVVDLASRHAARLPELGIIRASYGGVVIKIDEMLEARALAVRTERQIDDQTPWKAGVSRGSLFGELRGVMDFDGERQFFISPPSGPSKVQCVFTEELRDRMNNLLFKTVRVHGLLHYNGNSPFPVLMEATRLEPTADPKGHFSDIRGIFAGMEPPRSLEDLG